MRALLALSLVLAPGLVAAQELAALGAPPPAVPASHVDQAFAAHEARAHRLLAAVCLGCGTTDEAEDAPALTIPDLPPEPPR